MSDRDKMGSGPPDINEDYTPASGSQAEREQQRQILRDAIELVREGELAERVAITENDMQGDDVEHGDTKKEVPEKELGEEELRSLSATITRLQVNLQTVTNEAIRLARAMALASERIEKLARSSDIPPKPTAVSPFDATVDHRVGIGEEIKPAVAKPAPYSIIKPDPMTFPTPGAAIGMNLQGVEVRPSVPPFDGSVDVFSQPSDAVPSPPVQKNPLLEGPTCTRCGGLMQRTGTCYTCTQCGESNGCG